MEQGKIFRTKTGFCHILPDKIVLTRDGVLGNAAKLVVGNGLTRVLVIYALAALALFYAAYLDFSAERYITASICLLFGIFLLLGIIKSRNNSATPVIPRAQIVDLKFVRGLSGLTRSRFEVFFTDDKNRLRKRLILMPGSLNGEKEENEKALRILREEKLLA